MNPTFELSVEATFSAAHALIIAGVREEMHGHDFHVTLIVGGDELDADGLLYDFHEVERALRAITSALHNRTLNQTEAFARVNPSAERIAQHIGREVAGALERVTPGGRVRVISVRVTEAPGCAATYRA